MNAIIKEQRFQFVLSLYRIRTQYPQMGLFQPDFIWVIFRKMMPSKYNRTNDDIQQSVNEWCNGPIKAEFFDLFLTNANDGGSDDDHHRLLVGDDRDELIHKINILRAVANHQGVV